MASAATRNPELGSRHEGSARKSSMFQENLDCNPSKIACELPKFDFESRPVMEFQNLRNPDFHVLWIPEKCFGCPRMSHTDVPEPGCPGWPNAGCPIRMSRMSHEPDVPWNWRTHDRVFRKWRMSTWDVHQAFLQLCFMMTDVPSGSPNPDVPSSCFFPELQYRCTSCVFFDHKIVVRFS